MMKRFKCPDCGCLVLEEHKICPKCGCPAEFFLEEKKAEVKEDNIVFNFLGYDLAYPTKTDEYAKIFGLYVSSSYEAYDDFCTAYNKCGSIEKALSEIPYQANVFLDEMINAAVKALYECGIIITPQEFMEKYEVGYGYDYAPYLDYTVAQYAKIRNEERALSEYRQQIKASRGRWMGGGFGIKGALKGAISASMLNAGSDFIHSFGDSRRYNNDNEKIRSELAKLYAQSTSKGNLCLTVKDSVMHIFDAFLKEYTSNGYHINKIIIDKKRADKLYDTTKKFEEDTNKKIYNFLMCIFYYPGEKKYYSEVYDLLIENSKEEFKRFIDYWNIWYLFPEFTDYLNNEKKYNEFLEYNELNNFSFDEYSVENAYKLKNIVNNKYTDEYGFIKENEVPKKILDFLSEFYELHEEGIFDIIPHNYSLIDFCKFIRNDNEFGIDLGKAWILGLPERKNVSAWDIFENIVNDTDEETKEYHKLGPTKKNKEMMESNGDQIIFMYDRTSSLNGKKGICITRKYIYNLANYNRIPLNEVEDFLYDELDGFFKDGWIRFTIIGKNNSLVFEYEGLSEWNWKYFELLVGELKKRFFDLSSNSIIDLPREYNFEKKDQSLANNSDDFFSFEEYIDNFVKEEIKKPIEEFDDEDIKKIHMYCVYCGKQIKRNAKFCNYCGKMNNYGGEKSDL